MKQTTKKSLNLILLDIALTNEIKLMKLSPSLGQ